MTMVPSASIGMVACILLSQTARIESGAAAFVSPSLRPAFWGVKSSQSRIHSCHSTGRPSSNRFLPAMMSIDERLPSLPAMVGAIGGMPLLPGGSQLISYPSPGQSAAMQTALAFAAVDDRLGGKPVLAYFSSSDMDQSTKGIATIASIEELRTDDEGWIESALLIGVGRAVVPRVRNVQGKPLLVTDNWQRLNDDPPAASYMHSLEMMRPLEDDATFEHNERRRMLAKLTATSVDLQLCDLQGVCNTNMLLELGPDVYSKAQELIALAAGATSQPERGTRLPMNAALTPLPDLARKGARRVQHWDQRFPQVGDEVDGEMQYLRCFSFACWQALRGVVSKDEFAWAIACTDTMERIAVATEKIAAHKTEIHQAQAVLETLQSIVRRDA